MPVDHLWYKDAVIYQLHVKTFFDSNDNGIGDFAGLTTKLDYIQSLGVTAVWLLPFYPSPLRDDGYDIADYRSVHPAYGNIRDFRRFVRAAHARGLKVITELVVNHTSDQHPWFQRARRAKPGSKWRNYYVWSDSDQKYQGTRIIFTDTEKSNWSWDPEAEAYYWHRFFSHQPDLNFDNPHVLEEVIRTMRFWLDLGVDGLRLDAIPYLCEREGTNNENLPETHAIIRKLRAVIDENYDGKMLLGEANQWPEDVLPYFGNGDECHMAFHFPLMPRMYMAMAQEDRHPITDIMDQTPDIPENCQWAVFLRNHDELTLEMVTDRERDYLWNFYAADRRMRINIGIRRRLAPLVENDIQKIKLLNSLLLSMPGTPVLYYGDEIGMGDNVYLGDRDGVRTPMQWSPDRNGGFSRADPAMLYLPAIMDPVYGYEAVNVEAESRNPSSLLNWMRKVINIRKNHSAFGRGTIRFFYPGNRKVLAFVRETEEESILCIANLSHAPQPVELRLGDFEGCVPIELLGRSRFPPIGQLPYFITLPTYGFYWFILAKEAEAPSWHEPFAPSLPEFQTLVIPQGFASLIEHQPRERLERKILPEFLGNQRWFAAKDVGVERVELASASQLPRDGGGWLVATWRARLRNGQSQRYFLPLAIDWEKNNDDPLVSRLAYALGRVRKGAQLGGLYDAIADPDFARRIIALIRGNDEIDSPLGGSLRFRSTSALMERSDDLAELEIRRLGREQSNSSLLIGDRMIMKAFRKVEAGEHPEAEIGRHLTEVAHFENTPAFYGTMEAQDGDGSHCVLAILQEFVPNQGDGWSYSVDYLDRHLEEAGARSETPENQEEPHSAFESLAKTLGQRTAEMHRAFAVETDNPAFQAEPVGVKDLALWKDWVVRQAGDAQAALRKCLGDLADDIAEEVRSVLGMWDGITSTIQELLPKRLDAAKTRYHGDYHLGQVIVAKSDFYIIDFEGEPARSLEDRRIKHSPLRDIAGMLRSFNYAAWAALFGLSESRPEAEAAAEPWAMAWEESTVAAFLEGYRETIGDCPSYPADERDAENLIKLFTLEKALYEICYEAANRPRWLRIPLRGVQRIIAGGTGDEG